MMTTGWRRRPGVLLLIVYFLSTASSRSVVLSSTWLPRSSLLFFRPPGLLLSIDPSEARLIQGETLLLSEERCDRRSCSCAAACSADGVTVEGGGGSAL